MSILSKIISSYITSSLFHIGLSKITPLIAKQKTVEEQTEFDAELEGISLGSSAVTLILDNLFNQKIAPGSFLLQNILCGMEGVITSIVLAKIFGSESFKNLGSNELKVDAYILGTIAFRNFVLKQVWDKNIDVDDPADLQEVIGDVDTIEKTAVEIISHL